MPETEGVHPRGMPKRLCRHRSPRRMVCRHKAPHGVPVAYAESDVASRGACQERGGSVPERAGSMPERAGHVKLQTKAGNVALLCSDRHGSPS